MRRVDTALRALDTELVHWPDFVLEEVGRGHTWGGRLSEESIHLDNWFAILNDREGPKGRGHYQVNGKTMVEAIDGLTTELISRRELPHLWHLQDWMQESRFVRGCGACEAEARDLFDNEVEWSDE